MCKRLKSFQPIFNECSQTSFVNYVSSSEVKNKLKKYVIGARMTTNDLFFWSIGTNVWYNLVMMWFFLLAIAVNFWCWCSFCIRIAIVLILKKTVLFCTLSEAVQCTLYSLHTSNINFGISIIVCKQQIISFWACICTTTTHWL